MTPRPPIQAVIEQVAELDETRRNWRMVLFNPDGTPFLGEDGLVGVTAFADLTDVDLTGLTDGDILVWDSGTNKWVRDVLPAGGGESDLIPWTNLATGGTWSTSAGKQVLQYRQRADTKVQVRGYLDGGFTGNIGTLPPAVGVRPDAARAFNVLTGAGRVDAVVTVGSDGMMSWNAAGSTYIDLRPIEFYPAP